MIDRGPPPPKKHRNPFQNPMTEESLPEPQRIKLEFINQFFEACDLVAEINYRRPFLGNRIDPVREQQLSRLVQALYLKLSMKPVLQNRDGHKLMMSDIKRGKTTGFETSFDLLIILGGILQELGPLKIEYVRGVRPEFSAHEGDYVEKY